MKTRNLSDGERQAENEAQRDAMPEQECTRCGAMFTPPDDDQDLCYECAYTRDVNSLPDDDDELPF